MRRPMPIRMVASRGGMGGLWDACHRPMPIHHGGGAPRPPPGWTRPVGTLGRIGLAFDPSNPSVVWAAIESEGATLDLADQG